MEVICDGDTITNIVNGNVVNVGTKSSLTEGKIQFQSEGAEIFFRKIEVRPLLKGRMTRGGPPLRRSFGTTTRRTPIGFFFRHETDRIRTWAEARTGEMAIA